MRSRPRPRRELRAPHVLRRVRPRCGARSVTPCLKCSGRRARRFLVRPSGTSRGETELQGRNLAPAWSTHDCRHADRRPTILGLPGFRGSRFSSRDTVAGALAVMRGLSPGVVGLLALAAAATFLLLVVATKLISGIERMTHFHHQVAVGLASAGVLIACGLPVHAISISWRSGSESSSPLLVSAAWLLGVVTVARLGWAFAMGESMSRRASPGTSRTCESFRYKR